MVKFGVSIFRRSFNTSKCKTVTRLAMSRIKLLRNKREVQVKQMRRDVAMLLQSGQEATARIRVEHVIREQNIMAANEIIDLFCELVVLRLPIIAKQRECPADLKEGISSLLFAAPRCSDIPELLQIRDIFEKKYGKDFVTAAIELHPSCGVNRTLIEKLSVRTPTGEVKLKVMKEIAKEYQLEWDTKDSELELLKPLEEVLEGPRTFVSGSSMPLKPISSLDVSQPNVPNDSGSSMPLKPISSLDVSKPNVPNDRSSNSGESHNTHFKDTVSAAQAAAESAQKAIAAAQAAAYLANQNSHQISQPASFDRMKDGFSNPVSSNSTQFFASKDPVSVSGVENFQKDPRYESKLPGRNCESKSFDRSCYMKDEMAPTNFGDSKNYRRHSYNVPAMHSGIKFDDSDEFESMRYMKDEMAPTNMGGSKNYRRHSYNVLAMHPGIKFDDSDEFESDADEEIEMETPSRGTKPPPDRLPPPLPALRASQPEERTATGNDSGSYKQNPISRVHPKLPDYDELSSRFESLKHRRS